MNLTRCISKTLTSSAREIAPILSAIVLHWDASGTNLHPIAETKNVRLTQMIANRHCRRRALRERSCARESIKPAISHMLFVLAALTALMIQILVVQPHIHVAQTVSVTRGVVVIGTAEDEAKGILGGVNRTAANTTSPSRDKYPVNEDPSNCPLCQEIVYSGHFVQSTAILAVLLFHDAVGRASLHQALPSFFAVSHIWHGRAPPKA